MHQSLQHQQAQVESNLVHHSITLCTQCSYSGRKKYGNKLKQFQSIMSWRGHCQDQCCNIQSLKKIPYIVVMASRKSKHYFQAHYCKVICCSPSIRAAGTGAKMAPLLLHCSRCRARRRKAPLPRCSHSRGMRQSQSYCHI